jgi:CRISPR-associated protein Cmr2
MTDSGKSITIALTKLSVGIAWCLAWGEQRQPQFDLSVLQQMRQALNEGTEVPEEVRSIVEQAKQLQAIPKNYFPEKITELKDKYPDLWQQTTRIGLVYGGATKIKGYVFEAAKLQDIRGASAILDRINLVDLKAFFGEPRQYPSTARWLAKYFPGLADALIPELIIYSTGGNILAFCPVAYVHDLANAIERRYTEETLTANSCAVGDTFRLLEIRFGLLHDSIEQTPWLDWYKQNHEHHLVEAYFGRSEPGQDWVDLFKNRKSFNELAGKLAALFNKRRSGNNFDNLFERQPDTSELVKIERPSRRYPPMFETHPYLVRDESDRRNAVVQVDDLPKTPWFSEALARKRIVGQQTKLENKDKQTWFRQAGFNWRPGLVLSWVTKFKLGLKNSGYQSDYYQSLPADVPWYKVREARTLEDIAKSRPVPSPSGLTDGFVAYIYADGNNMGGYIQKIRTPEEYQQFSRDIFEATEQSVYVAIAKHLHPRKLENPSEPDSGTQLFPWVHPFEIITIGGDDVLLIVPADKALEIAQTIGEEFERRLAKIKAYQIPPRCNLCHRYNREVAEPSRCQLSTSIGVLITAYNTPIYYAQNLTEQLLKSAKARAKELKPHGYYGGTVDFLVMKSVTMISSKIGAFREKGLTKSVKANQTLKLYAAPYTLHELSGLLETAKALKESEFPRSQLYQIRSLLEQGKNTAILNYRYFRARLKPDNQHRLKVDFEKAWCEAKTNNGNLAPWIYKESETKPNEQQTKLEKVTYETIWRELVDLYPFIEAPKQTANTTTANSTKTGVNP